MAVATTSRSWSPNWLPEAFKFCAQVTLRLVGCNYGAVSAVPIPQMFWVIDGQGHVNGGDGAVYPIEAGLAALWDAEESHEAWTVTEMTVIVIELAAIQVSD